jgi:hypothetical protein
MMGYRELPTRLSLFLISVALLALAALVSACGGDGAEEPAVGLSEIDRDRSDLCFDAKTLPPGFELVTRNTAYSEGAVADSRYEEIGRAASGIHQYVFSPPSGPEEDADGILTPEQLAAAYAQAAREEDSVPFTAATCRVDVYETIAGARKGLDTERDALSTNATLTDLSLADITLAAGGYAASYISPSSQGASTATFRTSNVIGHITLSAGCGNISGERCLIVRQMAESLATLLLRRIVERLDIPPTDAASAETGGPIRGPARSACPDQDYLGCIGEYVRRAALPETVALCRTQYGGWSFEPLIAEPGDRCSDGESRIIAVVGGQ